MESRYLKKFLALQEQGNTAYTLLSDRILVEVLPQEEMKTAGGIIVARDMHQRSDTHDNRPTLAVVLLLGQDFYEESTEESNEETVAAKGSIKPGDVVLLSQVGLKYYSEFPGMQDYTKNTVALTRANEIHMIFPAPEGYEAVKRILNS